MIDIQIIEHKKEISHSDKLNRLYNFAYTVQELDGDFGLYMQFVDTDEALKDVPAIDVVTMWGKARRSLSVDKEIHLIYGKE